MLIVLWTRGLVEEGKAGVFAAGGCMAILPQVFLSRPFVRFFRYAWLDVSAGPFSWGPSRVSGSPNRFSLNKRRNDDDDDDDDDDGDVFRRDGDDNGGGGGDLEMLLIYWERYCRSFYDDKEKRLRADTGDDHFEPAICRELAEKLKTKFDEDAKDDKGKAQKKEWTR